MSKLVYEMEELDSSSHKSLQNLDFFILASSSDTRAYRVLSKMISEPQNKASVVVVNFADRVNMKKSKDSIFEYKKFKYKNLKTVNCDIKIPNSSLSQFNKLSLNNSKSIGLDISCFTKPYFYYLIKLFQKYGIESLKIFYTEPKSYIFEKGLFDTFHTSNGPLKVIDIEGYVGQKFANAKHKLVILLGFDGDLLGEINEEVSPEETFVVNGFPAYSQKFKDISLISNQKLIRDEDIQIFYARANNPFEVYNLLENIKYAEQDKTFLNIAPLGTKPMALGACLFALHNPEVRVVYPLPQNYEDKYSDQSWKTWVYTLPLNIK